MATKFSEDVIPLTDLKINPLPLRQLLRQSAIDMEGTGLDPLSVKRIEELLIRINRERGMTMIVVSHDVASTMRGTPESN